MGSDHPFHVEYPPNTSGRDYVVGDIHGHVDELSLLLTHHEFRKDRDRLFSVGDLIDRGPNSVEVVRLSQEPWFFPVRGNHEQLMIDAVCSGHFSDWIINGGDWCLEVEQDALRKMVRVVQQWPFAITINHGSGKRIGICHAQPPIKRWSNIGAVAHDALACYEMLWSRSRIYNKEASPIESVDWVFCGHTPLEQVTVLGNTIFIDTGVFLGSGHLTVLNLDQYIEEHTTYTV